MKKVLIIAAIIGVGYYAFGTKKDAAPISESPILPGNEIDEIQESIFSLYNNQVIVDKDGYWMLVKDGKLFTPISLETLQAWQNQNSDKPSVVEVKESVWLTYSQTHVGGTF